MFSDVHIVSKRTADYECVPEHSAGSYHAKTRSLALGSPIRSNHYFEIVDGPHGVYVVATNPTARTDYVGRRTTNSLILRAEDLAAALHLFDARHSLCEWSEKRWHGLNGGTDNDLSEILDRTQATTTEKELEKWQTHRILEKEKPTPPKGWAVVMHLLGGTSPPETEKQVGTHYYYEEKAGPR